MIINKCICICNKIEIILIEYLAHTCIQFFHFIKVINNSQTVLNNSLLTFIWNVFRFKKTIKSSYYKLYTYLINTLFFSYCAHFGGTYF